MPSRPRQEALRKIPSVDEMLSKEEASNLLKVHPRAVVVEAIRRGLGRLRNELLRRSDSSLPVDDLLSDSSLFRLVKEEIDLQTQPRLRRVINATGIVIHTNLGRAPLHPRALLQMVEVAQAYSNLEYDLEYGERGDRHSHVEPLLCQLSGAESALVVNNNAAAVLLCLNTIAEGREVIISRGELVEIGGAFRIPDVMKRSGALLKEVGTTNRTHLKDYQKAIGPETALLLKVHTSNFRVMGFTSEVSLEELVQLGRAHHLPVMEDLGSGCLIDLRRYGLEKEPTVQEAIRTGVDVVTISGDKLLGGPQAGIILGKKAVLETIKVNPLMRALRIDKLTLAALESTLLLYLDEKRAMEEVPTLRMLGLTPSELRRRGRRLLNRLKGKVGPTVQVTLKEEVSQVGGGALPLQELPTIVLALRSETPPITLLEERLRKGDPAIVSRISKGELLFDMRTVFEEEIPLLAEAIGKALGQAGSG
ncbi:MAG: L-seryl-tRNA(Sec) selenium transferase [Desulfobacterota bacterium]|nr:L-seryl-tRNA(Sec) selenium transferase [Thermodesulfobacteriota bacterium]